MSQQVAPVVSAASAAEPASPPKIAAPSLARSAGLISLLTLASRMLGMAREHFAAKYFGAGLVSAAFSVAFTIPNLFRRLFGEGAISAAFIPLYSQSLKNQGQEEANRFAAASVNLLAVILITLTIVGELLLWGLTRFCTIRPDQLLAIKLTAIMLPYVLLVCGTAFLGGILQVHRRFGMPAATPIVLNLVLIGSTILGARLWNLGAIANQVRAIHLVSVLVLVAGVAQVAMLVPSLRAVGFRFSLASFRTPAVARMIRLSIPVAIGAAVWQVSTLLDRGLSLLLAQGIDDHGNLITHFSLFGHSIPYPMAEGAAARLNWAQYLYQFPLGIFAIALATAIFPALSDDALDVDRNRFRQVTLHGIKMTLWEGLPASVGLMLVAEPAVQLLFQYGRFTSVDTHLTAVSVQMYAIAIWAFSLQQILNRAYYALHDTRTPLVLAGVALVVNLAVELPLLWTPLRESAMAVGTTASFIVQALVMLWLLQRRIGGLDFAEIGTYILKLLIATALMTAACLLIQKLPFYPRGDSRSAALLKLTMLILGGGVVYLAACAAMGVGAIRKRQE